MKNKFYILLSIVVLVAASLACNFSASTASINAAFMAHDQEGTQPTEVFAQDEVFYCIVELANAPDDTHLKAVWTAVDAAETEPNLLINETEIDTGSGQVHFDLSNDSLWPVGSYKVEIYMNDELNQTVNFTVQ